jgi:hypothetical protein
MTTINQEQLNKIFTDLCYSREMCRFLNINYANPSPQDYETLRECARTIYFSMLENKVQTK